jgi:amidohydrolase
METLKNKVKFIAANYAEEIVNIRRYLHANPELSNHEYKTAEYISNILTKLNIHFESGIFKTGIVALIKGKNPNKKIIALRADMDALPINEKNSANYRSKNDGVMHACGHDVHMASLIGVVKILNDLKDEFEGTVKFIFQPAEEKSPGGAKFMIEEGVLENPKPEVIYGQHVYPELEVGKIGMKAGKYMASTDEIDIKVIGKGGHAAMPFILIDPIVIASQIMVALQQVVSRRAHINTPTVLSFGKFIADGTYNVIPDEAILKGTFRTFDEKWRAEALQIIQDISTSIAKGSGAKCKIEIRHGYPFLVNDDMLTEFAFKNAVDFLGEENVVKLDMRATGEDFAYFAQAIPACFYRLGVRNEERELNKNLHTSDFDVDEKSLETGMGLMAWLALSELVEK